MSTLACQFLFLVSLALLCHGDIASTFSPFLLSVKPYPHIPFSFHFPFVAFMDGQTNYTRISFSLYLFLLLLF